MKNINMVVKRKTNNSSTVFVFQRCVYFNSGFLYEGSRMFTRRGIYNGEEQLFSLYRSDTSRFFLSLISEDCCPLTVFYVAVCSDEFPPENGWSHHSGVAPLPSLQYGFTR